MDQKFTHARRTPLDVVEEFSGEFEFLSNFHVQPFVWQKQVAPSAEHHYSAAKTASLPEKALIYSQATPGRAKREGQKATLTPGWDDHLKTPCMASIIEAKFPHGSPMAQRLLMTGEALLIEGNVWHDNYWGQCTCERHYHWPGKNMLGRLLMNRRTALRNEPAPYTRVGIIGRQGQPPTPEEQGWLQEALPVLMHSLRINYGMQVAISGLSPGVATIWARTALEQGIRLWGYLSSSDYAARQAPSNRAINTELVTQATRTLVQGRSYDVRWLRARDEVIERDSSALIIPYKENGGDRRSTALIRKALASSTRIIRINVTRQEITTVTDEGDVPWTF